MEGESKYEQVDITDMDTVCQAQVDITDMAFGENACYGVSLKLDSQNMSTPATIHQVQAEVTICSCMHIAIAL